MTFAYEPEIYISIRNALVEIVKLRLSLVGDNVSNGRRFQLENPYGLIVPSLDVLPRAVVSFDRCQFNRNDHRGARTTHQRTAYFQIDGYIAHDEVAAATAGVTAEEYLDQQLDLLGSQIASAIEYYALLRPATNLSVPAALRIRGDAELWVNDIAKASIPYDGGATLVGVVSVSVTGSYCQDRRHEDLVDLETIYQILYCDDQQLEPKEFSIAAPYLAANYFLAVGANGAIYKFGISHLEWYLKISGTTEDLFCIHGLDDRSYTVACGASGTVIYSTDNGETWNALGAFPDATWTLTGCYVLSSSSVWVCGHDGAGTGRVWHWDGRSWTQSTEQATGKFNGIVALGDSSVYVATDISGTRGIWYYDGAWQNDSPDPARAIESIYIEPIFQNIYAHDSSSGGENSLWYGSFGSWSEVHASAYDHQASEGRSVWVNEAGKVWMTGLSAGGSNVVVMSWDGLVLAEELNLGAVTELYGIYGRNEESIMTIGESGRAHYYNGLSWADKSIAAGPDLFSAWAPAQQV